MPRLFVPAAVVVLAACATRPQAATCERHWSAAVAAARGDVATAQRLYMAGLGPDKVARCAEAGG